MTIDTPAPGASPSRSAPPSRPAPPGPGLPWHDPARWARSLRRLWLRHSPWWLAWQALLTLATAWLLWTFVTRALGWALTAARWEAVTQNLRLFAVGGYPAGPLGGLALAAVLSVGAIALAFPFGVLLALGRRSRLPLVKGIAVAYIELMRGAPLVTILYMVALLVPLAMPGALRPNDVVRAILGLGLFTAAYIAEDVRGGLAAIGAGQYEAARALGLGTARTYRHVILPQALKVAVPALAGELISLFKNTALVIFLGLRELLGVARAVANQPEFLGTYRETYAFVALVFFVISYFFSRASRRLEGKRGA